MRPLVAEVADVLLDRALRSPRFDLIADYARPLPTLVAAELFGLPLEGRDEFRSWWYEAFAVLEGSLAADERRARIIVGTPLQYAWSPVDLMRRFRRRFGRSLVFRPSR